MILSKLLDLLLKIRECHPEADDAEVWAVRNKTSIRVKNVGFDKRHKPARIKLGEE